MSIPDTILFPIDWEHGDEYDGETYLVDAKGKRLSDEETKRVMDAMVPILNTCTRLLWCPTPPPAATPPLDFITEEMRKLNNFCLTKAKEMDASGNAQAAGVFIFVARAIRETFGITPPPAATPPLPTPVASGPTPAPGHPTSDKRGPAWSGQSPEYPFQPMDGSSTLPHPPEPPERPTT